MQFHFKDDLAVDFKLKDCGIVWITDPNISQNEVQKKIGALVGVRRSLWLGTDQ